MSERIELPISGMTCASCAARVEKRLNRLDGVEATVNYATERASVQLQDDTATTPEELIAAVEEAGYEAVLPSASEAGAGAQLQRDPVDDLRRRLVFAAIASLPVVALAMIPALQFDYWQWISLQLATPVLFWAAYPFHRAAWINLRLLAGRWFEARAKRSAGAALRALLELGAKDVSILDADGVEHRIPIAQPKVDHRFVVRPGEKIAFSSVFVVVNSLRLRSFTARRDPAAGGDSAVSPAGGREPAPA